MKKIIVSSFVSLFLLSCSLMDNMIVDPIVNLSYKKQSFLESDGTRTLLIKQRQFILFTVSGEELHFVSKGGYARITDSNIEGTVRHPDSSYVERKIPFHQLESVLFPEHKKQIPITLGMGTGIISKEEVYQALYQNGTWLVATAHQSIPWWLDFVTNVWEKLVSDLPF